MPSNRRPFVSDASYIDLVRKHRPSALMPIIAQVGASISEPGSWQRAGGSVSVNPWALADVARVSLVSGNEYRRRTTSRADLDECLDAYWRFDEPQQEQDPLMSFLFRKASEQLGFNESRYHNLLRTAALYAQTSPVKELAAIKAGWFEDLFGCTLPQYVGTGFIVHTSATINGGRFDAAWLENDDSVQPIIDKIPIAVMRGVVETHFVGDISYFRRTRPELHLAPLRRYTFNPLLDRPVVSGLAEEQLVPIPGLIDRKIGPLGIWYSGVARWGGRFATDMGELFEQYVGRHLALIPDATVIPEISYDEGRLSIDWIVIMKHAIVLVEVKSARPTEEIRLGAATMWEALSTKLSKAYAQVERASARIEERHSAFLEIPNDLPRLGLIVTMESFPFVNTPEVRSRIEGTSTVPTIVCSSQELELLVTLRAEEIDSFLLEFLTRQEKDGFDLHNELIKRDHDGFCRNTVMDAAWEAYDWGLPPLGEDD